MRLAYVKTRQRERRRYRDIVDCTEPKAKQDLIDDGFFVCRYLDL